MREKGRLDLVRLNSVEEGITAPGDSLWTPTCEEDKKSNNFLMLPSFMFGILGSTDASSPVLLHEKSRQQSAAVTT